MPRNINVCIHTKTEHSVKCLLCRCEDLNSTPSTKVKPGKQAQSLKLRMGVEEETPWGSLASRLATPVIPVLKVEAGGSQVQDNPWLHSEFQIRRPVSPSQQGRKEKKEIFLQTILPKDSCLFVSLKDSQNTF